MNAKVHREIFVQGYDQMLEFLRIAYFVLISDKITDSSIVDSGWLIHLLNFPASLLEIQTDKQLLPLGLPLNGFDLRIFSYSAFEEFKKALQSHEGVKVVIWEVEDYSKIPELQLLDVQPFLYKLAGFAAKEIPSGMASSVLKSPSDLKSKAKSKFLDLLKRLESDDEIISLLKNALTDPEARLGPWYIEGKYDYSVQANIKTAMRLSAKGFAFDSSQLIVPKNVQGISETIHLIDSVGRGKLPIILTAPYHNSRAYELHKSELRSFMEANRPELNLHNINLDLKLLEQNELLHFINEQGSSQREFQLSYHKTVVLNSLGELHASPTNSPMMQMPLLGKSIDAGLAALEKAGKPGDPNKAGTAKYFSRFGKMLSSKLSPEMSQILTKRDTVVALSDLPIELMTIDDVPLSVISDVVRLPESPAALPLRHYLLHSRSPYVIEEDLICRTLILNLYAEDSTFKRLDDIFALAKPKLSCMVCRSKDAFFSAIAEKQPQLLIIYTHGDIDPQRLESFLWIGPNIKLTYDDIVNSNISVPLVILMACSTAPVFGYQKTVASAFLMRDSYSVSGTLLPIYKISSFTFYQKFIETLEWALNNRGYFSWIHLLSDICRINFYNDAMMYVFENLRKKFPYDQWDMDAFAEQRQVWYDHIKSPQERFKIFGQWKDIIQKSFPYRYHSQIKGSFHHYPLYSSTQLMTHLGRGDLILFRSALKALY
jgi:hypothetical protein